MQGIFAAIDKTGKVIRHLARGLADELLSFSNFARDEVATVRCGPGEQLASFAAGLGSEKQCENRADTSPGQEVQKFVTTRTVFTHDVHSFCNEPILAQCHASSRGQRGKISHRLCGFRSV